MCTNVVEEYKMTEQSAIRREFLSSTISTPKNTIYWLVLRLLIKVVMMPKLDSHSSLIDP